MWKQAGPGGAAGLLMFFLLFSGYFMLRPVRETMGVAGGLENLPWLFTGTFVATLAVLPLFGGLASGFSREHSCMDVWLFRAKSAGICRGTCGATG